MALIFKIILILLLLFIIFNLARALIKMVKEPSEDQENRSSMSHYLGRRVMFSAFVVILLLIALLTGFIEPNSRPY
ncbi:DUF2909 domain-containing protein [Vibrio sp. ZSDE26]|uniref:DUF2909 domain-containing protein n=1 Tax=Vibrio amylolyticus TaxID=2847292 RepID=A0A9X2BLJ5_9VIBR|nr:DUF2909 family protein [Vibrio amylolyticus]MCK6264008.1 DUF2909 domain-containing protein [Vibrio amylolyticus]